jgi:hypothetical protein
LKEKLEKEDLQHNCYDCDFQGGSRVQIAKHMRLKHGRKDDIKDIAIECKYCGKQYNNKSIEKLTILVLLPIVKIMQLVCVLILQKPTGGVTLKYYMNNQQVVLLASCVVKLLKLEMK